MKVVGMFYVNCGRPETETLCQIMMASVRKVINGAHIVLMTNEHTTALSGVDEVIRRPIGKQGVMESRVDHFAHLPYEALCLDPDIVVLKDPWDVFNDDFDVALTKRSIGLVVGGVDESKSMPYNTGVSFSKNPKFWKAVHAQMQGMTYEERGWFGEQKAVATVAESGEFSVKELTCDEFNYSPNRMDEDVSQKSIVHYKGPVRKTWMLSKQEIVCE